MQFDRVRFDGANVELEWKEPLPGGGERDVSASGKDPTPAFKAALQSFRGYVAWIHSWPEEIVDRIEVRGVTIKRPEDEPRGIVVTALLKCSRARNSSSTVNTPFLAEPVATYAGDRTGFLPETTIKLIDELEERATEYQDGERGEQISLALGDGNVKQADERMAAAEVASTRKPKGKRKGKDFVPGVGDGETAAWEPAVYTATDRNGRRYTVTTGGTKRYPWRVVDATGNVDRTKTLLSAAEWIAKLTGVAAA